MRAAALASGQGLDANEMMKNIQGEGRIRRQESADQERGAAAQKRLDQQMDIERMREQSRRDLEDQQAGNGKYRHRSGVGDGTGAGDEYNPKVERANKAASAALDTSVNRFSKSSGLEALTKAHEEAERAMESLQSGNPAGAAHALEKFVSVSRGGMATNAALNLFQKHLGGVGATAEGTIAGLRDGKLGETQTKNLHDALAQVQHSIKEQVELKRQAFVRDYVASPAYAEMKGNTEDAYDKLFSPFGYQTEYDPNAKVIALGTGKRAAATGRGATNKLVGAAQMTDEDRAMVQMAKERLAKNPNDATAKQVLQLHPGM